MVHFESLAVKRQKEMPRPGNQLGISGLLGLHLHEIQLFLSYISVCIQTLKLYQNWINTLFLPLKLTK